MGDKRSMDGKIARAPKKTQQTFHYDEADYTRQKSSQATLQHVLRSGYYFKILFMLMQLETRPILLASHMILTGLEAKKRKEKGH